MGIKDKKFEITIVFTIVVFSIILFGLYLIIDTINSKKTYTLFLKPYTILECTKWDCENVSSKLIEYNNKQYKLFLNGKSIGTYDLYYNDRSKKYYIFNNNNDNIYNNEKLFAYMGKVSINQKNYETSDITIEELIKLSSVADLTIDKDNVNKISLDFDNDGTLEDIYLVNSNSKDEALFSVLIYKDKNKYSILDKRVSKEIDQVGFTYISNVIDIFEDGKLEFIYTTAYFDEIGMCNVLYRLKGNRFVAVNECEIVK